MVYLVSGHIFCLSLGGYLSRRPPDGEISMELLA